MENKFFFPVKEVSFNELFNWSDPKQKCQTTSVSVPQRNGLLRQNSRTGSLVNCNKLKIALFRYGEHVYAVNEKCPHASGPLHLGDVEDLPDGGVCVRCPWHSWRFDLRTGHVTMPKGHDITAVVYPVKVKEDGSIMIGFDKFADDYFVGDEDF